MHYFGNCTALRRCPRVCRCSAPCRLRRSECHGASGLAQPNAHMSAAPACQRLSCAMVLNTLASDLRRGVQ
eukprot:2878412-Alexandrium_andersonii.AAC.1